MFAASFFENTSRIIFSAPSETLVHRLCCADPSPARSRWVWSEEHRRSFFLDAVTAWSQSLDGDIEIGGNHIVMLVTSDVSVFIEPN